MRRLQRLCTVSVLALVAGAALAPAAAAKEAKPSIIAQAWYWENQQNQNVDTPAGTVSAEARTPSAPQRRAASAPPATSARPAGCP